MLMAYICENELMEIYGRIAPVLLQHGFECEIAMIRDYMLKVSIEENGKKLGRLIIDYSPKRGSFSFRKDSDMPQEQFDRLSVLLTANVSMSLGASHSGAKTVNNLHQKPDKNQEIDFSSLPCRYQAFVDGSFIEGSIGYGAVILDQGKPVAELYGRVDDPDAFASRQVGGEIRAVIETLEWCRKNRIAEICIFYDFENIEKWAVGSYKTNTPMTRAFKQYIDTCGIRITWRKVESHTGVEFNERADRLAKTGAAGKP